ncbi:MAG: S1/P1 nuclease [Acidobacteria bacterium]|nr:S1/P1 nuclease [Acidobacteriota bacterium]
MFKRCTILLILWLVPVTTFGYGYRGHAMVGAIADLRLSIDKPTQDKVYKLLDGITLAQAATIADSIKSWDICVEHTTMDVAVAGGARVNRELRAFVNTNRCDSKPSHHEFHYVDIPVAGDEKYMSGIVGRSDYDVVHMIAYCMRVLSGEIPDKNPRAITKTVAVILLAHYLGDIHQPLHVGAEYFDDSGNPVEPSDTVKWHGDQGGNKLDLYFLDSKGKPKEIGGLHSYWDTRVVDDAFGDSGDSKLALQLAQQEPDNWELTGDPTSLAQQMADEMMPIAREAHRRLEYSKIKSGGKGDIDSGRATERSGMDMTYASWSQGVVKSEIQKAGWRLAQVLKMALSPAK